MKVDNAILEYLQNDPTVQKAAEVFFYSRYFDQIVKDLKNPRSPGYATIKYVLTEQGHWKAKPRGKPIKANLKRQSTAVDMQSKTTQQVRDDSEFNDWGA